jgi:hypothetical protein
LLSLTLTGKNIVMFTGKAVGMQGGEVPPFSTSVTFSGHSFLKQPQNPQPSVLLSTTLLSLPQCAVGDSTFSTMSLTNSGCAPVHFAFGTENLPSQFSVFPLLGVIPAGQTFVVAVRFKALSAGPVAGSALLVLNDSELARKQISIKAAGFNATLAVNVGYQLNCPPTCMGATSKRDFRLSNLSRVPVVFEWDSAHLTDSPFTLDPASGILQGSTECEITCFFSPKCAGSFSSKFLCRALMTGGAEAAEAPSSLVLRLTGDGTDPALSVDQEAIDFGPVCIGQCYSASLSLMNSSSGAASYVLELGSAEMSVPVAALAEEQSLDTGATVDGGANALLLADSPSGTIPSRSVLMVKLVLLPQAPGAWESRMVCRIVNDASTRSKEGQTTEVRLLFCMQSCQAITCYE